MSGNEENNSLTGLDSIDHQPAYIYAPGGTHDNALERPTKRRKVGRTKAPKSQVGAQSKHLRFEPLLQGEESEDCVGKRQELFERSWTETDRRIQSILNEANEDTLAEVTSFVNSVRDQGEERLPASFIVTGPNIASQSLLFNQLSVRLKSEVDGPVVTLQSGDAANLKAVLKQLIRGATNQGMEDEDLSYEHDGRKLLYYDLEILHTFVKIKNNSRVVVGFQDSEAFDTNLLVELITLFYSWLDRIPFVLLFGIATSVELFQERLPKAATRCLYGVQVDVEQTSDIIERIFRKAVAGSHVPLRMGPALVSILMERQQDHVQSVQSFITALKYTYMCHFYGNPLSILSHSSKNSSSLLYLLQPCHYQVVRMLPSFRILVDTMIKDKKYTRARALLKDDAVLAEEIENALGSCEERILSLLRVMHVLENATDEILGGIDLYMTIFDGDLTGSDYLQQVLSSLNRMTPEDLIMFINKVRLSIESGSSEMDLDGWIVEDEVFLAKLQDLETKATALTKTAEVKGIPVRSSEVIHSKTLRTTVIAQRVQLSYQESTLTEAEKEFTALTECLTNLLNDFFAVDNPQNLFLNEVWLCDKTTSLLDVFAPRPRDVIENALSAPYEYLTYKAVSSIGGPSVTQPATAILYQRYLEAGSLINMSDLWSSFLEILVGDEGEESDEREALMQFYRALADLKLLGMVKQSKKKADHLSKVSWKGL